jgi:succinyl-diaminopimelate desuccinylase
VLQLGELSLADECAWIRAGAVLDELTDGCHTSRTRKLAKLGELDLPVDAAREDSDDEAALRLRPRRGIGLALGHLRIMPRYAQAVTGLAERLAARTLELVDIPSESGSEAAIRDHLRTLVPPTNPVEYTNEAADLFVPDRRSGGAPLVVLCCHYDTVPAQDNLPGRIEDGAVHGLGASDMKGGVAVAIELLRDLAVDRPGPYDVALLLFGREELPPEHNPLPALLSGSRRVHEATLAILLEPTDGQVQAGCLGHLSARAMFDGVSGHSARPWQADNAIERAIHGLGPVVGREPRDVIVGGLTFREVASITRFSAGIADNVIPDRAAATISFRYAPDRAPAEAERYLRALLAEASLVEVVGNSPPGLVATGNPVIEALVRAGARGLEPKQAWTNVADFSAAGIDAVNFGPGHTAQAHRRDEHVRVDALVHAYDTLHRLLTEEMGEDPR